MRAHFRYTLNMMLLVCVKFKRKNTHHFPEKSTQFCAHAGACPPEGSEGLLMIDISSKLYKVLVLHLKERIYSIKISYFIS